MLRQSFAHAFEVMDRVYDTLPRRSVWPARIAQAVFAVVSVVCISFGSVGLIVTAALLWRWL